MMTSVAKLFKPWKTTFGYSLLAMFNLAMHYPWIGILTEVSARVTSPILS